MKTVSKILLVAALPLALSLAVSPAQAAFTITQAAGANYVPVAGPVACGAGMCRTYLNPAKVQDLGQMNAGNTATLANDLLAQKGDYSINHFGDQLDINFIVTQYKAFNDGTTAGGILEINYKGNPGFVAPSGLHWIQIVTDNWNITGMNGADTSAPKGPGKPENVVDAPGVDSPFYDDASSSLPPPKNFNTNPPHFEDFSSRGEPTMANPVITWSADLFLVSDDGEHNLTVYDGVRWGWVAEYSATGNFGPIPEPRTWAMLILGFGAVGVVARRRRSLAA